MIDRLKSPVVWVSMAALISFITKTWFGWEIPGFDTFVELLLGVLVAFGVVNNPTDKNNF